MNGPEVSDLLKSAKTIAVVGLSSNPTRPSFGVAQYLQQHGYRIIPVNPNEPEILGEKSYASLLEIPDQIDIVDIFRRSDAVFPIVEEALSKGTRCVWMQQGVINEQAAERAKAAGVLVVMDECILKEHWRISRS